MSCELQIHHTTDRGELLLELFSEEIPARMQRRAIADLSALLGDRLAAAGLKAAEIQGYVTPRRLAIIARGIPAAQPERREERRGPRVGAPAAAVDGFLRATGLASLEECEERETDRGGFYFALLRSPGRPAAAVLAELIPAALGDLAWPKSMRWPGSKLRWVRPLRSIVCLFDGEVVPLALAGVPVGRTTRGHRFLAPDEIVVTGADDYLGKLEAARVTVDHDRRRDAIAAGLDRRAAELGVGLRPDRQLLEEVTGLAEFPVVLGGAIDADFMNLPPEVLATAMRAHQKYFSSTAADGSAAPYFLFVADNLAPDGGRTIVAGNERVLRARLADAGFFWDQDRKIRLEDRVEALKARVFHAKLGDLHLKAERVAKLAEFSSPLVSADAALSRRAAWLAKADLSTAMVAEFPELQGIVGRYCALHDGEDPRVADAIAAHYKPLGPNDNFPTAPESIATALADKTDTLVALFTIGEEPTGSRDPFGLRRAALGIVRIVLENRLRLDLHPILVLAETLLGRDRPVTDRVLNFIVDRLKVYLRDRGFRHDLLDAAFWKSRTSGPDDNLLRIVARAEALAALIETDDGKSLLTAYRRAANIVAIEEKRDSRRYDEPVAPDRLVETEEQRLALCLAEVSAAIEPLLREENFAEAMRELSRLRRPVDEFFDKVSVNAAEPELRANRLRLLSRIRGTMNRIADFSQIEG